MARTFSANTLLIESHNLGGDCTFTGCIPSKTLLSVAALARNATLFGRFTNAPHTPSVDFRAIMNHVRSTIQHVYNASDAPPNLEKIGVTVVRGQAQFTGPHDLRILGPDGDVVPVHFRTAIIATGSDPISLPTSIPSLTSKTIFSIDRLPNTFVIAGAGPVGIEMAQAFCRLGSSVTVVTPESRILTNDDEECALIVQRALEREGVRFIFSRKVTDFTSSGDQRIVRLDDGSEHVADQLFSAVGRTPRISNLGLQHAGVIVKDGQILYNDRCQTTTKTIYVSGDVAAWYNFTHAAEHMSRVAVTNALLHLPSKLQARQMAWATFTQPELAHTGLTERELKRRNMSYSTSHIHFSHIDRAVTDQATDGMIKVFATKRGHILGVSIVGDRAGDLIAQWTLAIHKRLRLSDISGTIHVYPTLALGNKRLADSWLSARIKARFTQIFQRIFGA